jgi:hypothetical protein
LVRTENAVDYWLIFPIKQEEHLRPYYQVRLVTDRQIGIDTAAGSGLLGEVKHFPPTFTAIEEFEEFELEKR